MPNYCSNKLKIQGSKEALQKALSLLIHPGSDNIAKRFSFNCAVPMPKDIKETTSPNAVVSDEEYTQHLIKGKVEGNPLFDRHFQTQAQVDELESRYGYKNWYDWAVGNWGVKWDADCYDFEYSEEEGITANLYTPWGPPVGWLEKFCQRFSNDAITISLEYIEEGCGLAGEFEFTHGELVHWEGSVEYACISSGLICHYNSDVERWFDDNDELVDDTDLEVVVIRN